MSPNRSARANWWRGSTSSCAARFARNGVGRAGNLLVRGGLTLDLLQHAAQFDGYDITLTAMEFDILKALLLRPSVVFNREQIMTAAYQMNIQVSDRTIDSHIRNIRAKLAAKGCDNAIDTVHGVGFRLGRCEPRA